MSMRKIMRTSCGGHANQSQCFADLCCSDGELLLSKVTTGRIHIYIGDRNNIKRNYQNHHLLWTIRNPINRVVSALDMKANRLYGSEIDFLTDVFIRRCGFRTAQDLADALDLKKNQAKESRKHIIQIPKNGDINGTEMEDFDCHAFGKSTLEGRKKNSNPGHATMGYDHYSRVSKILPNRTNFILRTEYLLDDVIQTNKLFIRAKAQEHENSSISHMDDANMSWISDVKNLSKQKFTHGSESWKIKSKLTPRGKEVVCCYLSDENHIYEELLLSAVNLSYQQKVKSLESLYRDCGILSLVDTSESNFSGFEWTKWRSKGCATQADTSQ